MTSLEEQMTDEFFKKGYEDFENGVPLKEYPTTYVINKQKKWKNGWRKAQMHNEKPISQQYLEIKSELEFNQQEYKDKQDSLLKRLEDLQKRCPHDEHKASAIFNEPTDECKNCGKVFRGWQPLNENLQKSTNT